MIEIDDGSNENKCFSCLMRNYCATYKWDGRYQNLIGNYDYSMGRGTHDFSIMKLAECIELDEIF